MAERDIALERLHAQHLLRPLATPVDVVSHLCAVQAQDFAGARWALGLRARGCVEADVDRAFDSGAILRTHVLRPTWHFVTPADLRWLLALTAPRVHAASAYAYRTLELDEATSALGVATIARALEGGNHLTRDELATLLAAAGIVASGPRLGYVMMRAELDAVICSGPRRGKQHTYALFDERVPAAPARSREEALAELARRYVAGHGPAQAADLAWWSGLTVADARRGLELAGMPSQVVNGKTYWTGPRRRQAGAGAMVHLLPNYDECLIAFKDRSDALDPRVVDRNVEVLSHHFVLSNGRLVGGWRRVQSKAAVLVECRLLAELDRAELEALHGAAARFGRFLGCATELTIAGPPRRRAVKTTGRRRG
ncbi:MAG TPA: winged helix DNA-binding domain-containing protein [Kofleriaceae bacterium]|nr:winged helix DNA-binding domain-containing protein [Kofleriaceae bacterium]